MGDMIGEARISEAPWLAGPVGKGRIGSGFHEECAREAGLEIIRDVIPKPGSCQTSGRWQGSVRHVTVWRCGRSGAGS